MTRASPHLVDDRPRFTAVMASGRISAGCQVGDGARAQESRLQAPLEHNTSPQPRAKSLPRSSALPSSMCPSRAPQPTEAPPDHLRAGPQARIHLGADHHLRTRKGVGLGFDSFQRRSFVQPSFPRKRAGRGASTDRQPTRTEPKRLRHRLIELGVEPVRSRPISRRRLVISVHRDDGLALPALTAS